MSIARIASILRNPRRVFAGEDGFSLIEVLAALFIFTLLTLGLVPLLTSSIGGTNTARADTIGKNAALKAMERVRGLPFHVSYATSTTKVDLLDLYYPSAAGDTSSGGTVFYRTICAWNALTDPACPRDVPANYTITFEAQFVDPVATGTQPTVGETATSYRNVDPALVNPNYAWNSAATDTPPRQIVMMSVIATWTVGGDSERYTLTSLLSDRSFGGRKVKGTATLGYGLDFYTAYDTKKNTTGNRQSASNIFIMRSDSDIEGRRLSTAIQNTTAARAELERDTGGSLATIDAATSTVVQAPPDQTPANVTATTRTLLHPDFSNATVSSVGPTSVTGVTALAASAAPSATGDTQITGVITGTTEYAFLKDPQLNNNDFNALNLSTSGTGGPSIASLVRNDGLPTPVTGISAPVTTGLTVVGGSRAQTLTSSVHTQATTGFDRLLLMKSNWIPDPAPIFGGGTLSGAQGAIIVIDDFQAAVRCDSNTDGTGTGDARYQGTLYYWADPVDNSSRADGSYRRITFNVTPTSAGTDPLATVMAQNSNNGPLVYDHASANQQIYLFGKTLGQTIEGGGRNARRAAYLGSWNSLTTTASGVTPGTDETGQAMSSVNSSIDGAIEIETADLDTTNQVDGIVAFSMGSLSCFAEDTR